jgi:hypothetical protein
MKFPLLSMFTEFTACRAALVPLLLAMAAIAVPVTAPGTTIEDREAIPVIDSSPPGFIPSGSYLYKFSWNGIPSAESTIAVTLSEEDETPCYIFEGTARTSKFADLFWRFRAHAVAVVDAVKGQAKNIRTVEQENKRFKETETVFDYESEQAYYVRRKKGKEKGKTITLEGGVLDPVCFGMRLFRQALAVGDSSTFTVLVGDDPYALEYDVTARERISISSGTFDALRLEPRFHKIGDEDDPPKVRQMTIWVTESEPHIPLRMKSGTFIGHVTGELVRIESATAERT